MLIEIVTKYYSESFETFQDRVNSTTLHLITSKEAKIIDVNVNNLEEGQPCAIIKYTKP